jgi:hypothetical protein
LCACCKLASTTRIEKWLTGHRNKRIFMSMKMIISGAWWGMATHSNTDFAGKLLGSANL